MLYKIRRSKKGPGGPLRPRMQKSLTSWTSKKTAPAWERSLENMLKVSEKEKRVRGERCRKGPKRRREQNDRLWGGCGTPDRGFGEP